MGVLFNIKSIYTVSSIVLSQVYGLMTTVMKVYNSIHPLEIVKVITVSITNSYELPQIKHTVKCIIFVV